MMRQSSSRNQRNGGWKVKHVVQICVLVAVGVWLLYQVKHSHDRRRALEERNPKLSERGEENRADLLMFGRKDLRRDTVLTSIDNTTQTEEEESKEAEEAAEKNSKQDEIEEEGRTAGDGEIEENDRERADEEAEGGEEFGDEVEREGRSGDPVSSGTEDHEGSDGNSQEAREEHYKADDASSAVVKDTQEIDQETEDLGTDNSDEQKESTEKEELGNGGRNNGTEGASNVGELNDVPVNGESQLYNDTSLMETAVTGREAEVGDLSNSTMVLESSGHIEYDNATSDSNVQMEQESNSTSFEPNDQIEQLYNSGRTNDPMDQHNNSTVFDPSDQIEEQNNLTGTVPDEQVETQGTPEGVSTETSVESNPENVAVISDSAQDQNVVNETRTLAEDNTGSESISLEQTETSVDSTPENATAIADSTQDQNMVNETTTLAEDNSSSESVSLEQTEKSDPNEGVNESDETPKESSVTDEIVDAVQGEPNISSSNLATVTEEEQDGQTNPWALPEVEKSVEGVAAE